MVNCAIRYCAVNRVKMKQVIAVSTHFISCRFEISNIIKKEEALNCIGRSDGTGGHQALNTFGVGHPRKCKTLWIVIYLVWTVENFRLCRAYMFCIEFGRAL